MGDVKLHNKTNINALKILITREKQNIVARTNANKELLSSPVDV